MLKFFCRSVIADCADWNEERQRWRQKSFMPGYSDPADSSAQLGYGCTGCQARPGGRLLKLSTAAARRRQPQIGWRVHYASVLADTFDWRFGQIWLYHGIFTDGKSIFRFLGKFQQHSYSFRQTCIHFCKYRRPVANNCIL
jgi:hypothetical protein